MKLIVASNNAHKIEEIKRMLKDMSFEVLSLNDVGIDIDVVEDGNTFEENSLKKADEIYKYAAENRIIDGEFAVMADDSGLETDYLNGAPGIYSARYSGVHGDSKANNRKLLKELEGVKQKDRTARFVCVITVVTKDIILTSIGTSEGYIIEEERGHEGFGYDPIFYSFDLNKTFAEATGEEKDSVSHRARAMEEIKKDLIRIC